MTKSIHDCRPTACTISTLDNCRPIMFRLEERDVEENRKPGGKTRVMIIESLGLKVEDAMGGTTWKKEIQNYSSDIR